MPSTKLTSRIVTLVAIAALSLSAMAPALARPVDVPRVDPTEQGQTDRVDGEALGASNAAVGETNAADGEALGASNAAAGEANAAAGEANAAQHQTFANETVQAFVLAFTTAVRDWTGCMELNASSNETTEGDDVVFAHDACGSLDTSLSPGTAIAGHRFE